MKKPREDSSAANDRQTPTIDALVDEMRLDCGYKDATFEMLSNDVFIKAIEEKYQYGNFAKRYSEQETIGQR